MSTIHRRSRTSASVGHPTPRRFQRYVARHLFGAAALLAVGTATAREYTVVETPIDLKAMKPALVAVPVILPAEVDIEAAKTFIKLGFGLDDSVRFDSQNLLTTRLRTVQAQQLIGLVKSYNSFEGEKVARALGEFRGKVSGVEFGRESSPVIYIDLPYWTHQREETPSGDKGVKIPDSENDKLVKRLEQVFVKTLYADEFDVDGRRVRIWWD